MFYSFLYYTAHHLEDTKYSQQQTIYLAEIFSHSNLLQSSLASLSIVHSLPKTPHRAETSLASVNINMCILKLLELLISWGYSNGKNRNWNQKPSTCPLPKRGTILLFLQRKRKFHSSFIGRIQLCTRPVISKMECAHRTLRGTGRK